MAYKRTRLRNDDKLTIQKMYFQQRKTPKEISDELMLTENIINKYIDRHINQVKELVIQKDKENKEEQRQKNRQVDKKVVDNALNKLCVEGGFTKTEANRRIKRVLAYDEPPKTVDAIYNAAIKSGSFDLMVNRTNNGRGGVSVMTKAAAEMSDELKKKARNAKSRSCRGAIFKIRPE